MISRNSNLICGNSRKPLATEGFDFIQLVSAFHGLELENGPRSPRAGSSGTCLEVPSSKHEKPGNQSGANSGCLIRGKLAPENQIPRASRMFRELPRDKQPREGKTREPRGVNCLSMLASNSPVKWNRISKVYSVRMKGTKKAPEADSLKITEVPDVLLQSFKSCRGHHLKSGLAPTIIREFAEQVRKPGHHTMPI